MHPDTSSEPMNPSISQTFSVFGDNAAQNRCCVKFDAKSTKNIDSKFFQDLFKQTWLSGDLYDKIQEQDARFTNLEAMVAKNTILLEKISKLLQQLIQQQHGGGTTSKPACLPISSLTAMTEFQNIDEDSYQEIVNYFEYVGGFSLKEAISLIFKEAFTDQVLTLYSWLGRDGGNLPLCETRIVRAIHDAVIHNRHFARPSRKEIAEVMKATLRAAKERARNKAKQRLQQQSPKVDSFWIKTEHEEN